MIREAPEYLVEITSHNGTTTVVHRFSQTGYTTKPSDTPANTLYRGVLRDPGGFEASLWGDRRTLGMGDIGQATLELLNNDGALDGLIDDGIDGRTIVVKRLANVNAALSTAVVVLRGTGQAIDSDDAMSMLRVIMYDRKLELDKPLQENRYTGETTGGGLSGHLADGTPDMKDRLKPLVFGVVFNITPITVNPYDLIYQVNDGAVESIVVMDGRVLLTLKQDYATVALLQAATIAPGKYGTCLAEGLFRLGCPHYYPLTANVTEHTDNSASKVVERMLTKIGLTGGDNIDATSFSDFDTLCPQETGIYLDADQKANDAVAAILASVGGYIVPLPTGPFAVGRGPDIGTPAWELDANNIEQTISLVANPDTDQHLPAYLITLKHTKNYTVQKGEQVCAGTTAALKSFAELPFREIKKEDSAVQTQYLLSQEMIIETLLVDDGDADAEADRRAALYGTYRFCVIVPVDTADADDMVLGTTGTVTLDRFGWGVGMDLVLIQRKDNFGSGQTILTLWG